MTPQDDAVALRALCVNGLPMLVVVVGDAGRGRLLRDALDDAGFRSLPGLIGQQLPKGAKVGFVLNGAELRLVDEHDDTLLRAPRSGVDEEWISAAVRLKGTMTIVLSGEAPAAELAPQALVGAVDEAAGRGQAIGAIVGVHEERTQLPLIF